eukprot:CAMPEP_0197926812 /NCGR_PEP_ID=MMETSP1439-20131203/99751_1 /TAXON_ID=66791 /ORGANISM="Gonyaulax spinifera, Strain CCMP409" /LENGTH=238 /DNA_ID=CAMNT_0043549363 /DNA_START=18 /DNA_END=735 /DNA_ORIENTATION=-
MPARMSRQAGTGRAARFGALLAAAAASLQLLCRGLRAPEAPPAFVEVAPAFAGYRQAGGLIRSRASGPYTRRLRSGRLAGGADAPSPPSSESWRASVEAIVAGVEGSSAEEAEAWLLEGFGWTQASRRFWKRTRVDMEPEPEPLQALLGWMAERGIAKREWLVKFPAAVGLTVQDVEAGRATAPSYMKSEDAYLRSIRANPRLLAKSYDCMDDMTAAKVSARAAGTPEQAMEESVLNQ